MRSTKITTPQELLSSRKLKVTATRKALISLLLEFESALPYSQIQETLNDTDRITLYRTIQTLLDKGIIHKAFTNNEDTYYALCGNTCSNEEHQHDHIHFKCKVCNTVSCENVGNEIEITIPHFKIENININLSGICKECLQD